VICLRPATTDDIGFLYRLRVDPVTQANSNHRIPEDMPRYSKWVAQELKSAQRAFYIAVEGPAGTLIEHGTPIGFGALTFHTDEVELSVVVAPEWRVRGYAVQIITELADKAKSLAYGRKVAAYIKADNYNSVAAFSRANFHRSGTVILRFIND
jgi:L-amino acid N-acyltransferase YncA